MGEKVHGTTDDVVIAPKVNEKTFETLDDVSLVTEATGIIERQPGAYRIDENGKLVPDENDEAMAKRHNLKKRR